MQMFLNSLLKCSIVMSVISLAYMVAIPLLSKKYFAKWLYYIWLLVVIGWVFPFQSLLDTSFLYFELPDVQIIQAKYIGFVEPLKIISNATNQASSIPLWWIIASLWAFGTIGLLVHYAWRHERFLKMVNRWSEDVKNQEILGVLNGLRKDMGINNQVGLKTCPFIASPMMIGFFRPTILLPCNKFDSDELRFILSHELIHLKRKDLWYKALILLTVAVHWFNPLVYIMAKAIAVQCEISCDELLVQKTSLEQRKQYGETLIGIVRNGVKLQTALSTNFYKEGNFIKTRILRIMDATRKKTGITVLCIIFIAIMGSRVAFASSPTMKENGSFMTQNEQSNYSSTKYNKIINVDVKTLESKKYVCFEETYTFEEGDIVQYNAGEEVNSQNVTVAFIREGAETYDCKDTNQFLTICGYYNQTPDHHVKITQSQAGNYYLIICNDEEEQINNIMGTIRITKGKANKLNG